MKNFTTGLLLTASAGGRGYKADLLYIATQGGDLPAEEKRRMTDIKVVLTSSVVKWRSVMSAFTRLVDKVFGERAWLYIAHRGYLRHLQEHEVDWLRNERRDPLTAPKAQWLHHKMLHKFFRSCAKGRDHIDYRAIRFTRTFEEIEDDKFGFNVVLPGKRKLDDMLEGKGDGDRGKKGEAVYNRSDRGDYHLYPNERLKDLMRMRFMREINLQSGFGGAMCLKWHLMGKCSSNCSRSAMHRDPPFNECRTLRTILYWFRNPNGGPPRPPPSVPLGVPPGQPPPGNERALVICDNDRTGNDKRGRNGRGTV